MNFSVIHQIRVSFLCFISVSPSDLKYYTFISEQSLSFHEKKEKHFFNADGPYVIQHCYGVFKIIDKLGCLKLTFPLYFWVPFSDVPVLPTKL
jgi:hypothetical protein